MNKLSVLDFKEYCDKMSFNKYVFSTDNQDWDSVEDTMRIEYEFNDIKINFNPNVIRLKSGNGYIKFERVKYIILNKKSLLGNVFTAVCGDLYNDDNNRMYKIIGQ